MLKSIKLNAAVILFLSALMMIAVSLHASAASVPAAYGQIDSYDGAILRQSATTDSAVLSVLTDNSEITIHKEIFKSKTSISKTKRWYYVTADGTKGYVRADLVDNIEYRTVSAVVKAKTSCRKGAGTKMKKKSTLAKNARVTVVLKARPVASAKGASSVWYKIKVGSKYYYVCSKSIDITASDTGSPGAERSGSMNTQKPADMTDAEYIKYLKSEGFPVSYRKRLRKLHRSHPDWVFTAYKTNMDWSKALSKQTGGGRSLVSGVYPSKYRDGSRQYEKGWYKASSRVVAYYMDPRNFLNENSIYMFEDLSYKPEYQTVSAVSAILSPTELPSCGFRAKIFVDAGKASDVSPVFLASRARQETGNGGAAVNGSRILGKKVYNPFNIGAFGGTNPLRNGLVYAYGKGWTTPAKSVKGGAKMLAKNYINKGQYTTYYQRFNVRNGSSKAGTHQYMTNIMAPYSEALSTRSTYKKYGITSQSLVFEIPVYDSMPKSTKLP